MRYLGAGVVAVAVVGLQACGGEPMPPAAEPEAEQTAVEAAPGAAPRYMPAASVVDLMRSIITVAAEEYWGSVSIVVDADGIHENFPETTDEWRLVWAAGISLAESGNLLMMPPRAIEEEAWMQYSRDLVDVGIQAAQAATDRDAEAVLAIGETIYNVCIECHRDYVPRLPDL